MLLTKKTIKISKKLEKRILTRYPIFKNRKDFHTLFAYSYFSNYYDSATGLIVLQHDIIRQIVTGRSHHRHKFNLGNLLNEFKALVMNEFDWIEYSNFKGKKSHSRLLAKVDPVVLEWIKEDLKSDHAEEDLVVFAEFSYKQKKKQNKAKSKKVVEEQEEQELFVPELTQKINQETKTKYTSNFNKLLSKNKPQAFNYIENNFNENKQIQLLKTIQEIAENPQPVYKPSKNGRSPRLFAQGTAINYLPLEVKQILLGETCVFYDLKSAHLAIGANVWQNDVVVKKLTDENWSVWNELIDCFDWSPLSRDQKKKICKASLYAIIYGQKKHSVLYNLKKSFKYDKQWNETFNDNEYFRAFFENEVIESILRTRDSILEKIKADGGMFDAQRHWKATSKTVDAASVMSWVCQTYELQLLSPIFDLAKTTKDFWIVLWEHDGLTICFENNKHVWEKKIKEVVKKECEAHNIHTKLEEKQFPTQIVVSKQIAFNPDFKEEAFNSKLEANSTLLRVHAGRNETTHLTSLKHLCGTTLRVESMKKKKKAEKKQKEPKTHCIQCGQETEGGCSLCPDCLWEEVERNSD